MMATKYRNYHGNVSDVRRPDLIRPGYLHASQQIGIDFMARRRFTGPGAPVDGLETHQAHQSPDTFPVDQVALALKARRYLPCPIIRCHQVLAVNQFHESEILLRNPFRLVIQARAADSQQTALAFN